MQLSPNKVENEGELLKEWLPLVNMISKHIFNKYGLRSRGIEYQDLVSYGMIGALDAIRRNSGKDNFKAYIKIRVQGSILDFIRDNSPLYSRHFHNNAKKIRKVKDKIYLTTGQSPTIERLSKETGLSAEIIRRADQFMKRKSCSIDQKEWSPSESASLLDKCKAYTPEYDIVFHMDNMPRLMKAIDKLDKRYQQVIKDYFFEGKHLHEIGKELGITESGVSYMIHRAIRKMSFSEKPKRVIKRLNHLDNYFVNDLIFSMKGNFTLKQVHDLLLENGYELPIQNLRCRIRNFIKRNQIEYVCKYVSKTDTKSVYRVIS